jgi:hypothetical protein
VNTPELTAFLASGVVARNALLNAHAQGPSTTGTMPYWLDLDSSIEQNYSNDDPADLASPQKIAMSSLAYRTSYLNQGWSSMDLTAELLDTNPLAAIKRRTSVYWLRRLQKRIIAIARGILAKNIATNSSDMVIDISTQDGVNATGANKFNSDALINAAYTMGDAAGGFVAIGVHSHVKAQMVKNDDIEFVKDSNGSLIMERYKGLAVITDDSMPVIAGTTSGFRYVSVLFAPGVIGLGLGTPETPNEVERVAAAGNGGGMETFWERKTWLLHPIGHSWIEGTLVEKSPTDADLALSAHWVRATGYTRKHIPIAFLITN